MNTLKADLKEKHENEGNMDAEKIKQLIEEAIAKRFGTFSSFNKNYPFVINAE